MSHIQTSYQPPLPSPAWGTVRHAEHLISRPPRHHLSWTGPPSFHKQHAQGPQSKPVHHRLLALIAPAPAPHRIASYCIELRPTSTRPSLYRLWPIPLHPASRPCGLSCLSCLTTLSTTAAEPSSCPAVQRTDRRRALLRVAAASSCACPPVSAVGLAPGPRAARSSFCHPLRAIHHPPLQHPLQTE